MFVLFLQGFRVVKEYSSHACTADEVIVSMSAFTNCYKYV